jgi:hypothetical protein
VEKNGEKWGGRGNLMRRRCFWRWGGGKNIKDGAREGVCEGEMRRTYFGKSGDNPKRDLLETLI